jgi:hypothetical protein
MWAMIVALTLVTVVLANFIVPRDWARFVLLAVVWLVVLEILEIIVALIIINLDQFSKPDEH